MKPWAEAAVAATRRRAKASERSRVMDLLRQLRRAGASSSAFAPSELRRDKVRYRLMNLMQQSVPANAANAVVAEREVDEQRLAADIRPRHEAPVAAVLRVVAVV